MIVNITDQFRSYAETVSTQQHSAPWVTYSYVKSSESILEELSTLKQKIGEL